VAKNFIRFWLLWLFISIGVERVFANDTNGPSEILLGMSTALSGPAANLGLEVREGVLAGVERVNRAGGVNGHRVRLIALDDGYEPSRTAPNMRQLLEKEHVLTIIGNVGTPTAIVAVPIANEQKTLFFAPFTGAGRLRKNPPDHYVINYRASYAEEIGAMVDALIDGAKLECGDIAIFTQRDGYGDAGFDASIDALKRHGLKDKNEVIHVDYERNTLAVEDALATLLYAEREPKAIIMVGAYAPCAKFIRLSQEKELKAIFLNVSFVGSNPLASALGKLSAPVIVTQVVPHPFDTGLSMVSDYQSDMKAFDPSATFGFGSLEGYIDARILVHGLETIRGEPTREQIVGALEKLEQFDLGLGEPLKLDPTNHQACHRVWPTILRNGQFVPFQWPEICALLKSGGAK